MLWRKEKYDWGGFKGIVNISSLQLDDDYNSIRFIFSF